MIHDIYKGLKTVECQWQLKKNLHIQKDLIASYFVLF